MGHEGFDVGYGGVGVTAASQSLTRGGNAFSMRDVCVQGRNIKRADDRCFRYLVLDAVEFPKEVWGVMDVGRSKRNKRFDIVINIEGDVLCRGAIAREDGSTRVSRFVDLGKEIETSRFSINRGKEFVCLPGEMFAILHVIKCGLDL